MRNNRFGIASLAASAMLLASPVLGANSASEITNAAMHAGLAAQASDIAAVHAHLHHTVNCLVGPGGAGFDLKELNPCANTGGGAIPDSAIRRRSSNSRVRSPGRIADCCQRSDHGSKRRLRYRGDAEIGQITKPAGQPSRALSRRAP